MWQGTLVGSQLPLRGLPTLTMWASYHKHGSVVLSPRSRYVGITLTIAPLWEEFASLAMIHGIVGHPKYLLQHNVGDHCFANILGLPARYLL